MNKSYCSSAALALASLAMTTSVPAQSNSRYEDLRPLGGEWSAADTIGAGVRSADGDEVGEVHDLILSADAEVVTAVISVGGLLGIADKLVAVPYGDLRVSAEDDDLAIALTSAEVEAAPAYRAAPPAVGHAEPVVDPVKALPPGEAIRNEAEAEAARASAGNDPRVADGIAENKKAYEDAEVEQDAELERLDGADSR
jgi:hypothetical protein